MDKQLILILQNQKRDFRWEDEDKAVYDLEYLREEFRKRLWKNDDKEDQRRSFKVQKDN